MPVIDKVARSMGSLMRMSKKKKWGDAVQRRPLTGKRANKNYYKGTGATSEGHHTRKGGYITDRRKMLNLMIPSLEGFELKAYVSHNTPLIKPTIV